MTGVDGNQVEFHRAFKRAELKYEICGTQPQIVFDLLLNLRRLYVRIARRFNHYLCVWLENLGNQGKVSSLGQK